VRRQGPFNGAFSLTKPPSSAQDGGFGFGLSCRTVAYLSGLEKVRDYGTTVNERYFWDTYGERAEQMRRLTVIVDVAPHLNVVAEVVGRYVAWARGHRGKE
jgi:hypothetical protein